jgi:mannose-6-phosphate isomerase-like protein (cupin superfamily)
MIEIRNIEKVKPYITIDKSEVREIYHPRNSEIKTMSLAEATVPVGESTEKHYHAVSDEIYVITEGIGIIEVEEEVKRVEKGDCIFIPVRKKHKIKNIGKIPLKVLCICSPPYSHQDTYIVY